MKQNGWAIADGAKDGIIYGYISMCKTIKESFSSNPRKPFFW